MTFGEEGKEGARVHDVKDINAILDIFQAHGHDEVCRYGWMPLALVHRYARLMLPEHTVKGHAKSTSERPTGKDAV
jgi:hypothetical protein